VSPRVLFVEDEAPFRRFAGSFLEENGFTVDYAADGAEALDPGREAPDLVLLDLNLPDMDGLEILRRLRLRAPNLRVVVLTSYGDAATAVKALKAGATDYLTKPIELEALLRATRDALAAASAVVVAAASPLVAPVARRLVGEHSDWVAALTRLERVAFSDLPTVLLLGESGTGKTALARHFHGLGGRTGTFVEVDCPSIPEALFESELFGYVAGAFKGADADKLGTVEVANGGTLLLDEIGELPRAFQPKLLRFLESRTFRPVGADADRQTDVRLVCTTNKDLRRAVNRGSESFRRDLFYRLEVVSIVLPPLRDRGEDILLLAKHFLREHAERVGDEPRKLTAAARTALLEHSFPGNVRELENLIRRAVAFTDPGSPLDASDFEFVGAAAGDASLLQPVDLEQVLKAVEARYVEQALAGGTSQREAGVALGLDRFALARRRKRLEREGGRAQADRNLAGAPAWLLSVLAPHPADLPSDGLDLIALRIDLEQRAIAHALRATGNNRARAATLLGMSRTSLGRRLDG
jgi:DNA-binding NtrC family response regulator